ncbi:hypothetical protein F5X99DRAFT_430515 [Biscogniauxia marginata]|nr:hypothetical protein F5X99DRAFT_430515 [Biscogniauxia marginata]
MDAEDNVYLGTWINWSQSSAILGATFTTSRRQGDLLIAFTALFIPYVASRFWRILCFVFHTCYSTRQDRDAIYHQQQVVLRNSSSPDSGLLSLIRIIWAWRHGKDKRSIVRMLSILLFATCSIVLFTMAGGFSSQISTAAGDEVLLKGERCGFIPLDKIYDISIVLSAPIFSQKAEWCNDAANYAQQCYGSKSSGMLGCNRFIGKSIPTARVDLNAGCPFPDEGICKNNNTNIALDTGLVDSHYGFGINAPEDQRFAWRYALQCAPLRTEGYTGLLTENNKTYITYKYGGLADGISENITYDDYTYVIDDIESQYTKAGTDSAGSNYKLYSLQSQTAQGQAYEGADGFVRIRNISRSDGDITLVFLSGNGVVFDERMDDDWYQATVPDHNLTVLGFNSTQQSYRPAEAASPLGCVEQWQVCNSSYKSGTGCGPLGSSADALNDGFASFDITQEDMDKDLLNVTLSMQVGGVSNLDSLLTHLGAYSLASQSLLQSGTQFPLPHNQWQLDVMNWWNAMLASYQALYVETVLGPGDATLEEIEYRPSNDQEWAICNNQKIRSTAYASFSIFGLSFTYGVGAIIIIISVVLDPILRCLHRRRKHKQHTYLEWRTHETFQLHRLAHEELGYGKWDRCTDFVPITESGDILAGLDISDPEHPLLLRDSSLVNHENPEHNIPPDDTDADPDNLSLNAGSNNETQVPETKQNQLPVTVDNILPDQIDETSDWIRPNDENCSDGQVLLSEIHQGQFAGTFDDTSFLQTQSNVTKEGQEAHDSQI